MINKKSIWFLTLFSLVLVLSVYYITMPNELLLTNNGNYQVKKENTKTVSKEETGNKKKEKKKRARPTHKPNTTQKYKATVKTEESEVLTSIRIEANEKYTEELDKLKAILTNKDSSTEEKNNAYEKMKTINNNRGKEEILEKKILETYKLNSCVLISGTDINVTVSSDKHDIKLANNIMRLVQTEFESKMYTTVKFQK